MTTVLAIIYLVCLPFTVFFIKVCLDYLPYTHKIHSLVLFISVWIVLPLFPIYLLTKYLNISCYEILFDRHGDYAGTSMQGWEILLLLLFPVTLIIFFVFLPFFILYKYDSREEDKIRRRTSRNTKSRFLYYLLVSMA